MRKGNHPDPAKVSSDGCCKFWFPPWPSVGLVDAFAIGNDAVDMPENAA